MDDFKVALGVNFLVEGNVLSEKVVEVSVGLRSVGLEHPEISTKKKIC